jgi:hypothetical protein
MTKLVIHWTERLLDVIQKTLWFGQNGFHIALECDGVAK